MAPCTGNVAYAELEQKIITRLQNLHHRHRYWLYWMFAVLNLVNLAARSVGTLSALLPGRQHPQNKWGKCQGNKAVIGHQHRARGPQAKNAKHNSFKLNNMYLDHLEGHAQGHGTQMWNWLCNNWGPFTRMYWLAPWAHRFRVIIRLSIRKLGHTKTISSLKLQSAMLFCLGWACKDSFLWWMHIWLEETTSHNRAMVKAYRRPSSHYMPITKLAGHQTKQSGGREGPCAALCSVAGFHSVVTATTAAQLTHPHPHSYIHTDFSIRQTSRVFKYTPPIVWIYKWSSSKVLYHLPYHKPISKNENVFGCKSMQMTLLFMDCTRKERLLIHNLLSLALSWTW